MAAVEAGEVKNRILMEARLVKKK